ncbi:TRPA1 family protein [Megaselia abdita]
MTNRRKRYQHFFNNWKSADLNLPVSLRLPQWSNVLKFGPIQKVRPEELLEAAEAGNLEDFSRLYQSDFTRMSIRDGKGMTPAHHAARKNHVNILNHIYKNCPDLVNSVDNNENTPLHLAVANDSFDALEFLLQRKNIKTGILNRKKQAPVHLATELNKVQALELMGKYKTIIDIQQGGEHGRTALHLAAIYDHEECARILITVFDSCPRKPCNNGYYPIHEAAKNASSKTMEVFFQWGESLGCTREEMLSFYDSEGNVPLHSAVHGGDIKAVELCLKSGAKISTQQHDLSTPVHLACAQGAIDIVKLMFAVQPQEKRVCLQCNDVQHMTPLHCAAMFDHPDIVEYLVQEGANIDALDKDHRSPLLLSASRSCWKTVYTLIKLGSDICIKDGSQRNVLHFIIMNGGCLPIFAEHVKESKSSCRLHDLLNEKDSTGCSPLHYASREGHIRSLENLIQLGACVNLKNNNNESPLHFAARYGRYNTVKQLLDSEKGSFIINESDGEGLTPLHISSQHGHTRVVQLLLNRGALLHRDHKGRTPLHLAAMCGHTETMNLLHTIHSQLLDQVDKDGNTALHFATMENRPAAIAILLTMSCKLIYNLREMSAIDYAIFYKFQESALAMVTHERANEVMCLKSDKYPCVTLALIASMPTVFEAVLDKCITKANCKKESKSFYIKYAFWPMQYSKDQVEQKRITLNDPTWRQPPLLIVNTMVNHGRVELLAHPLSQKYLQMKWNSYGKYFHLANLLLYSIYLICVTIFSAQMMQKITRNFEIIDEKTGYVITDRIYPTASMYVSSIIILIYIIFSFIKELIQLKQTKCQNILEISNLISWMLFVFSFMMILPVFSFMGQEHVVTNVHYTAASITVFLSWFRLLLYLQRFDQVGIYVVMFLEILQTLIKVLTVFSILIIAFGLSFHILLFENNKNQFFNASTMVSEIPDFENISTTGNNSFSSIPMSLMRTFSMMLGELDFVGTYVVPYYNGQLKVPLTSFFILVIFMIFMPILLMNLLIGLAVGDIESVKRNAQLKRLAMQVVLHTELERKLPHMWVSKVDKMELIEYPNECCDKLGFFDILLRKWLYNPFSESDNLDMAFDNNDDFVTIELERQQRKLTAISRVLDQQHQLLRLIVQKMEIKTEADDVDEGISSEDSFKGKNFKWNSPRIRNKLVSNLSFTRN